MHDEVGRNEKFRFRIGSLHMWAREDNNLLYSLIIQDTLEHHIVKSVSHKLKEKRRLLKAV